jgi:hypothetical protein
LRRFGSILLAILFTLLGSGALEHVHNLDHAARDAAGATHGEPGHDCNGAHRHSGDADADDPAPAPAHGHDESNCDTHAQLQAPLIAAGWVPLLVCLGLFVAFLTLLSPRLTPQRVPLRTDCRGPPAC